MAKRISFPGLPVVAGEAGDTIAAYRDGQIVRIAVPSAGGGGTVTSVGVSMPSGFEVANSPITSSGTITVSFAAGYGLPTTTAMGQWSTAFGWGDHALAGYALASAVASALEGKVDNTDPRLSDAREWTASTVGQAEAEAGTATTRRAWTAQRVWQAITAWWNASAAKSKLDGIQAGATANQTDAYLLNRANHTGTQAASTITGLSTVATTGSYSDLTGKPTIPAAQVPADWNATSGVARILNKPTLGTAAAANTGDFATAAQGVKADTAYGWGNHASAGYALSSSLATVATTGSYGDLSGKPTLGTAASKDVPSAGNATSTQVVLGNDTRLTDARTPTSHTHTAAQVTGLAAVATTGSYNDLSDKPTLGTAAAANTGDFATAAQGAKADTALQPAAIGVTVQGYSAALNGTTASFTTALKNKLDGIAAGATANTGTVTSVQVAMPTGLQASGGPVTTSGTLTISYQTGYSIPANSKQSQWDTAYGWGNHASAGYAMSADMASALSGKFDTSGGALTGRLDTAASTSAGAGLNLPYGVAPSAPVNGDIWTTAAGLFVRIQGVTRSMAHTTTWLTVSQSEAEEGAATTQRFWNALRVRQSTAAYAYSKTEVDSLLTGYVTPAAMQAYTYDKTTIDDKIDAGGSDSLTLEYAQAIALLF